MQHFIIDGFKGFRSRFDHIQLAQEVLEEMSAHLALQPAMPPFLLPYYNGVVAEDCGVSAFVLLRGGHMTLHTFSFREAFFADIVTAEAFDAQRAQQLFSAAYPCEIVNTQLAQRYPGKISSVTPDSEADFGPHVFLDLANYAGPRSMDDLFDLFDRLPREISMTPIMRPYIIKGETAENGRFISAVTMIAESHIILHIFPDIDRAYFDLFSCQFFDYPTVIARIKELLPGDVLNDAIIGRGSKYHHLRTVREDKLTHAVSWLPAVG